MNRRWFVMMGVLAAAAGGLLLLIFLDNPLPRSTGDGPAPIKRPTPPPTRPTTPNTWENDTAPATPSDLTRRQVQDPQKQQELKDIMPLKDYPPSGRFGQQADDDRKKLGDAAYLEMDKLWTKGQRPRGNPESMKAMEELLKQYPNTWRAGCAAYELGLHHLKDGNRPQKDRVESAQKLLEDARGNYSKSRCDGDASAGNMATLALAQEVYKYTDRNRALSLLDEMAALPPNETDASGHPLSIRAQKLRAAMPAQAPPLEGASPPSSGK